VNYFVIIEESSSNKTAISLLAVAKKIKQINALTINQKACYLQIFSPKSFCTKNVDNVKEAAKNFLKMG